MFILFLVLYINIQLGNGFRYSPLPAKTTPTQSSKVTSISIHKSPNIDNGIYQQFNSFKLNVGNAVSQQLQGSNVLPFIILNFVAIIWGTQHVCIKTSIEAYHSTSLLNFWRFFLSSLLFSPALYSFWKNKKQFTFENGIELGIWTFLGFACQAIGLETTTASRSAFLLYLNVKFVPFLAAIFLQRKISLSSWGSAFLAFSGTWFLSNDGRAVNSGDLWCILAAFFSALFILRLEKFSSQNDAAELNAVSFSTVAGLCGLWLVGDIFKGQSQAPMSLDISTLQGVLVDPFLSNPWPAVYLGLVTTALCNYLQTIGQRSIPAERAAIIYSLDPVYGAFFSRIFLDERLGIMGYVGAGLILLGVWWSSVSATDETKATSS